MTVVACNANFTHDGEEVSIPPPPYLAVVAKKCQYLPRHIWQWRWTNVTTSPAKFGGGGGQVSLPPPPTIRNGPKRLY